MPMLDDVRKYMRAGIEALGAGRSEDFAATVVSRAQAVAEQMSGLAAGFLEWSAEARASLLHEVRDMVARQVDEMGLASKRELQALRKRIERLEASTSARSARARPKPAAAQTAAKTRKAPAKASARSAGSGRR